jgi:hypothetical protein
MMFYYYVTGTALECQNLKEILDMYCFATCMEINLGNYALYTHGMDDLLFVGLGIIFPFQHLSFNRVLRYLGFNLKPNNYGKGDCRWMLSIIEKRFTFWCNRWIYIGGRLLLIKFVLEAIPVF